MTFADTAWFAIGYVSLGCLLGIVVVCAGILIKRRGP